MKKRSIDGEIALRGIAPTYAARRNKVYEGGRVCSAPRCDTRLSVYNASTECWQHTEVKPFILQVPRRRRRTREVAG